MTPWLKLSILNILFAVVTWLLYRDGILATAWLNDTLFIIPSILALGAIGMIHIGHKVRTTRWCAETAVVLGFVGTAYGIWMAFGGIDPAQVGNTSAIAGILSTLLKGLGAALWTTLAGVYVSLILSANLEVLEA